MQLLEWIKKTGKSQKEVALELGFNPVDISRYCSGGVIPRPENMQKIVEYTGGEVQPNDFYEKQNNG